MTRVSINPGRVEWSGENPGIYLKTDPANADYDTLALFFRVVLSPYGRGHAAIVLGAPGQARGWPDAPNLIMTDNQRLMRWILNGWVTRMPTFRGLPGLDAMTWLDCDSVEKRPGDLRTRYSETLRGSGVTLQLTWQDIAAPVPVELTRENAATRAHEMYSVLLEAKSARVLLNGTPLHGQVVDRSLLGRTMSTAFLAFSETWVTPQEDP